MKTKEAIKYFGGANRLAKALGISFQAVYAWGEYPPLLRAYQIQEMVNKDRGKRK